MDYRVFPAFFSYYPRLTWTIRFPPFPFFFGPPARSSSRSIFPQEIVFIALSHRSGSLSHPTTYPALCILTILSNRFFSQRVYLRTLQTLIPFFLLPKKTRCVFFSWFYSPQKVALSLPPMGHYSKSRPIIHPPQKRTLLLSIFSTCFSLSPLSMFLVSHPLPPSLFSPSNGLLVGPVLLPCVCPPPSLELPLSSFVYCYVLVLSVALCLSNHDYACLRVCSRFTRSCVSLSEL